MTEHQHADEEALRDNARALFASDDTAPAATGDDDETPTKPTPGNVVPREGNQPTPPHPDDERQFVRDLFDS